MAVGYRREIIIGAINMIFNILIGRRIAYMKPITHDDVFVCVCVFIGYLTSMTLFNMFLIKIGKVNRNLKAMTNQYVNLLNGMHEGLLILSQCSKNDSYQFQFCNKSAQKLITNFLGPIDKCHGYDP